MMPSQGNPLFDARYVVFVPLFKEAPNGHYVEPQIAAWSGNKWHMADSRPVLGWIGPLPVLKVSDFVPEKSWDEVFSDMRKTEHGSYVADAPQVYDL